MSVSPTAQSEQFAGIRLIRAGLARMVAGVRGAVGVAAVASALVGMGRPLSWWWLAPALIAVVAWTTFYVVVAWTRGLGATLIGGDLLLTALLCLAVGKLVPPHAVSGTLNWDVNIASMAVVSAQLAGLPAVSVPAGLLVSASYLAGSWFAHSRAGGILASLILAAQTAVAALVMVIGMRAEYAAVRAFTDLEQEQTADALAAARRRGERAQLRMVHSGPLSTLAMALHADTERMGASVRQRAAAARQDLLQLAAAPSVDDTLVQLDERLAQVVVWYESQLRITAALPPCSVPIDVAEAFAGGAAEALENVVRYAETQRARVELQDDERMVRVTVTDQGRGFDPAQVSSFGFGLREDVPGRMAQVGGAATINASPGAGAVVQLEWHRD